MPLFAESEDKIFGEILSSVVNNTAITRTSPGSKTRALAEALSQKLGNMYTRFDLNVAMAFLQTARGKYLDFFGAMFNTPRLGEESAKVTRTDLNIKFYVDMGTFGDINGGNSINVPQGTIIRSVFSGTGIAYKLTTGVILTSDSSSAFVSAEATRPGERSNIGKGVLKFHDFLSYIDATNDTLKVTNDGEIVSGHSFESDTNYRFRLANTLVAREAGNATAIRLAALSVPGVAEIFMLPFARGIGTYDLLVQATTPTVPDALLSAVSTALSRVESQGIVSKVRAPVDLGMALTGRLKLRRRLSAAEESNLIRSVTQNITNYINNLRIGEDFIMNEAIERVMATSDLIKNVGSANNAFESLYLYIPTRLEDGKIRNTLLGDYLPNADEKISVESANAGSTPILFTIVI